MVLKILKQVKNNSQNCFKNCVHLSIKPWDMWPPTGSAI